MGSSFEPIGQDSDRHRPADGFLGGIAKEPLSPAVPTHDYAVEILGKDRIVPDNSTIAA